MKISDLKAALKAKGMSMAGTKPALEARLAIAKQCDNPVISTCSSQVHAGPRTRRSHAPGMLQSWSSNRCKCVCCSSHDAHGMGSHQAKPPAANPIFARARAHTLANELARATTGTADGSNPCTLSLPALRQAAAKEAGISPMLEPDEILAEFVKHLESNAPKGAGAAAASGSAARGGSAPEGGGVDAKKVCLSGFFLLGLRQAKTRRRTLLTPRHACTMLHAARQHILLCQRTCWAAVVQWHACGSVAQWLLTRAHGR